MGKSEKTGLGRSLVKKHNNMIQQSKDKGKVYKSLQKKVLESVTEVTDIEAVIEQADEAELLYSNDKASLNPKIDMYVPFSLSIIYTISFGCVTESVTR